VYLSYWTLEITQHNPDKKSRIEIEKCFTQNLYIDNALIMKNCIQSLDNSQLLFIIKVISILRFFVISF